MAATIIRLHDRLHLFETDRSHVEFVRDGFVALPIDDSGIRVTVS